LTQNCLDRFSLCAAVLIIYKIASVAGICLSVPVIAALKIVPSRAWAAHCLGYEAH